MERKMDLMSLFDLSGKKAIVTGGSGRYGRQMVEALASAGATVYTASRNLETNEALAGTLRKRGLAVYAGMVDQGDEESIKTFLTKITEDGKKVDILVNNSVYRPMRGFDDDAERFDDSMRVNATGIFMISRAFGDHMAANGGGSIINIGSYMGILGPDDTLYKDTGMTGFVPDYFFHKGGMNNFTRFLAAYYGPKNVRCNILNLGGLFNHQDERFVKRYNERTFLKRMANETDIMGAVVFLASDASAYITGSALSVDGGYSAK